MNNNMKNYDYEHINKFEGLMPNVIEQAPGTVGASEANVEFMGFKALGADAMEVVDAEKFFDESEGGE